jgi:hypothetical protein
MKEMNAEVQKLKIQTFEQILEKKNQQMTTLKEQLKIAEALNYGVKNVSKKVEEVVSPKKSQVFQFLLEGKISPEVYKSIIDSFEAIESITKSSATDSEKILYTRQCEVNFLNQDMTSTKTELSQNLSILSDLEKSIEAQPVEEAPKKEYIRPDKNPKTKIGRAAMDLAERKRAWKEKQEAEGSTVIVDEELIEDEPQSEPVEEKTKEKKGKKKIFNLF